MTFFELQPGETILYQSRTDRTWYLLAWKIFSNLLGMALLIALLYVLLSDLGAQLLEKFFSQGLATLLSHILFLGLLPLLGLAWITEDTISTFTSEFVLTNRRMWVKGSPYAWSQGETSLDDVASVTFRREAIFVHQKSTRKVQIHMFPEGKLIVQAYEQYFGKDKPTLR